MKQGNSFLSRNWMGVVVLLGLGLFPFALALFTGQPLDAGAPKFWQGMLIQVFVLAVLAIRCDFLM